MESQEPINSDLSDIAKKFLGVTTLATRNSDQLDFYDLAVWNISAALEAAFLAGQLASGEKSQSPIHFNNIDQV